MTVEIVETRGQYRAVIVLEEGPSRPGGDFFGTIVWLDDRGRHTEVFAHAYKQEQEAKWFTERVNDLWNHYRDMKLVERYLRIFAGVVGFDYLEREDSKFVNIVTMADLKIWGFDSVEAYRTATGHDDPSHGNLVETEAWADGDVWGIRIEKQVRWTTSDEDFDDKLDWETIDDTEVWGHYTEKWAREAATDALDEYAPRPCKHCGKPMKRDESATPPWPWVHEDGDTAHTAEAKEIR